MEHRLVQEVNEKNDCRRLLCSMKKMLLCVDDHQDSLSFLVEWLRLKGYEVKAAHSRAKAIDILRTNPVIVAIIDANLGDDDGFDLCKEIVETFHSTKVIVYSGDTRQAKRIEAIAAGAKSFFEK